jgi:hypothetical protein
MVLLGQRIERMYEGHRSIRGLYEDDVVGDCCWSDWSLAPRWGRSALDSTTWSPDHGYASVYGLLLAARGLYFATHADLSRS